MATGWSNQRNMSNEDKSPSSKLIRLPAILLTGPAGIGKSTIIQKLVAQLGETAGGFYTREVRQGSQRTGFEIVTLTGQTVLLATKLAGPTFTEEMQFGQYRVNLTGLDTVAVPALREAVAAGQVVVIDEIGPMELFSPLFCQTVQKVLDSRTAVIGTIVQRPYPGADQVKTHPRVTIRQVTPANRDQLVTQLETELSHWVKRD